MTSIELSYIVNQLLNFKVEENEDENIKKEQLFNNLYESLKITNEINNCPELKFKILNTIKEIFTNYERHQNQLGKTFNNYIIGSNPSVLIKSNFKNPYNFLRLNCEDFEICKYEVTQNDNITEIKMLRNNFFPIRYVQYNINNVPKIQERIQEIQVTKKNLYTINIEYIKTTKNYINSTLDNIVKKTYNLNNFHIQNFNNIGFNQILDIIYYEIEQKHLDETPKEKVKTRV